MVNIEYHLGPKPRNQVKSYSKSMMNLHGSIMVGFLKVQANWRSAFRQLLPTRIKLEQRCVSRWKQEYQPPALEQFYNRI